MKFAPVLALVASTLFSLATAQATAQPKEYYEIYNTIEPKVEEVKYSDSYDSDFSLLGYASIPPSDTPLPAVVIIVSARDHSEKASAQYPSSDHTILFLRLARFYQRRRL